MGYTAYIVVLTLCSHIQGNLGQQVMVTLQSQIVREGDAATFVCEFEIVNDIMFSFEIHNIGWWHNTLEFVYFLKNSKTPVEKNKDTVSNYTVSRNASQSVLVLNEVRFLPDSGNYTCDVEYIDPSSTDRIRGETAHASLTVYVLPTLSSMYLTDESGPLENGETVILEPGKLYNFSCGVRGTRPKATIQWYLGEELVETFESTTRGENELVNTHSYWSTIPGEQYHDKELRCTCTAFTSYSKEPYPTIQVNIHVKTMAPECDTKNITSTSAVVKCSPAYDSFEIRRYQLTFCKSDEPPIHKIVKEGGTVEFILKDLEPFLVYAFEVFKNDSFGLSKTSVKNFTTLPRSPEDLGISAYVDTNGAISVKGIPASYRESPSSSVRIERYLKHQEQWVTLGDGLKEDLSNITFEDVQIRHCEGHLCSDASPAKQGDADASKDVSYNCVGWIIITVFVTIALSSAFVLSVVRYLG